MTPTMTTVKRLSLTLLLTAAIAVATINCHGGYVTHPGSANTADSVAYDALRDAQAVIDTARPQLASGALSANLKPAFNALVEAYDKAMPVWKAYHQSATSNASADRTALDKALADLTAALTAFRNGQK